MRRLSGLRVPDFSPAGRVLFSVALAGLLSGLVVLTVVWLSITPVRAAGISISKSTQMSDGVSIVPTDTMRAGEPFTYTIRVTNTTGNDIRTDVTDTIPTGVTVVDSGGGTLTDGVIKWQELAVNDGEAMAVRFSVIATQAGDIVNADYRATSGSNFAVGMPITTTIVPGSPDRVAISGDPDPATVDSTLVLTVTVVDAYGNGVVDGTPVTIDFDHGTIDGTPAGTSVTGTTTGGKVVKTLSTETVADTAHITATASGGVRGTAAIVVGAEAPETLSVTAPATIPADGVARAVITATVHDTYTNPVAQFPLTVTTSIGTLDGNGATRVVTTNEAGRATATLTSTVAGSAQLTVMAGSLVDTSRSIYLAPGPPTHLALDATPSSIVADGTSTTTIEAHVLDQHDNPVDVTVPVTITTDLGTFMSGGTTYTETSTTGTATVVLRAGTQAGQATVRAATPDLSAELAVEFKPGPSDHVTLDVNPPAISADGASTAVLTATVRDTHENPIDTSIPITFAVGAGTLLPDSSGVTVDGIVTRTLRSSTTLGTVPITVTAAEIEEPAVGNVDFVVGPPDTAEIVLVPASPITVGVPTTMTITVRDSVGHLVPHTPITVTTTLGTIFPSPRGDTDANGTLQRTLRSTQAGLDTLTVHSLDGPLTVTGGSVEFNPDAAVQAALVAEPAEVYANGVTTAVITVTLRDRYGNPVPDIAPTVTTTLGTLSGDGATDVSGVATRTLHSTTELGTAVLSIPGMLTVTEATVGFVTGPPAVVTYEATPDTAVANGEDTISLVLTATDSVGHPIVGETLVVTSSIGTRARARVSDCTVSDARGSFTCSIASTTSGQPQLYVAGVAATGNEFSFDPGALHHIRVTPYGAFDTPLLTTADVPFTFTAEAQDFYDNLIPGLSFTWDVSSLGGDGTVVPVSSRGVFVGTLAGLVRVKASAGGETGVSYAEVQAGAPAQAAISADRTVVPANGSDAAQLSVQVMDVYGNAVEHGVPVTLTSSIGVVEGTAPTQEGGIAYRTIRSTQAGYALLDATNLMTTTGDTEITFTPGTPASASVSAHPPGATTLPANGTAQSTLVITLRDSFDNPVGAGYTPDVRASMGTISGEGATDAAGRITRTLTAPTQVGTDTLMITYAGAMLPVNGDEIAYVVGPFEYLDVNPDGPLSVPAGQPTTFTSQGYDGNDAPIPAGINYGWDLRFAGTGRGEREPAFGAQTTFTGTVAGEGVQLVAWGDERGSYGEAPVEITVVAGPPVTATVAARPLRVTADGSTPITFTLTNLADVYGNTLADGTVVTVTLAAEPVVRTGTGVVSGEQAEVVLTSTTRAGTYPISVTGSGGEVAIAGDSEVAFAPGPPAQAELLAATPAEITADGTSTGTLVLALRDAFGNSVESGLTPSVTTTLGSLSGTGATDTNGILTRTLQAGLTLGEPQIYVDGIQATGQPLALVPGLPVTAEISVVTPTTPDARGRITPTLPVGGRQTTVVFDVRDAWDHPVADGTTITPTITPALAALSGDRYTTNGRVTQTLTSDTIVGEVQLDVEGLTVTGDVTVRLVPAPAAVARMTADPTMLVVGDSTTVHVTVTDAYSNTVLPTAITLTATYGTLDGVGTTITKMTSSDTSSFTVTLSSTAAATETFTFAGPSGPLSLHPASDQVVFIPGDPEYVTLDPGGPLTAPAGIPVTITASSRDVYGNAVDPWSPVEYAWQQRSNSGNAGYGSLTAIDGHARSVIFMPEQVGTNQVWATSDVTASARLSITVISGSPAKATVDAAPGQVPADGVSSFTIRVSDVSDVFGNPVPDGVPLTVTVESVPALVSTGVLSNGVVTASFRSNTKAGTFPLTVDGSGGALNLTGDTAVVFMPGPPVRAHVAAMPASLPGDGESTASLVVTVFDENLNRVADGTPVTVTADLGTVSGAGSTINGEVTRILHAPVALGTADFSVEAPTGPLFVTGDTVEFVAGSAAVAYIDAEPAEVPADGVSTSFISGTIQDAGGFRIETGGVITLSVGRGTITPTATFAEGGTFTATFAAGAETGPAELAVTFDGRRLLPRGDTLELIPGPAVSGTIEATPASLTAGSSERATLTIRLWDDVGRPIRDGAPVTVTTTYGDIVASTPSDGTSRGGIVTRTLTPGTEAGTTTITVTTPAGAVPITGDTVTIIPGPLDHISISPAGPLQLQAGDRIAFDAQTYDAFDNERETDDVEWLVWPGTGSGVISFDGVFTGTSAGTVGIQASKGTVFSAIEEVTVLPGPPATATVDAQPTRIPVGGTGRLTVQIEDAFGNAVADGTQVDVTSNLGQIVGSDPVEGGMVTRTLQAGPYFGKASIFVNGREALGDSVTIVPGARVFADPDTLVADGRSTTTLKIDLLDRSGTLVPDGTRPVVTSTLGTVEGESGSLDGVLTRTLRASTVPGEGQIFVDGFLADGSVSFTVGPAAVARIDADPPQLLADGRSTSDLTVWVEDAYDHVITDAGSLTVSATLGTIGGYTPTVDGMTTRVLTASETGGVAHVSILLQEQSTYVRGVGDAIIPMIGTLTNGNFEEDLETSWLVGSVVRPLGATTSTLAYTSTALSHDVVGNISVAPLDGSKMVRIGATTADNTGHAVGEAWVRQSIYVPTDTETTQLEFWYRILSYDVAVGSELLGFKEWDPFEVRMNGEELFQDGIVYSSEWQRWYNSDPTSPRDLGWQRGVIDVGPYVGGIVTLEFRVANRQAPVDNTWVYIDGLQLVAPSNRIFLPFVGGMQLTSE